MDWRKWFSFSDETEVKTQTTKSTEHKDIETRVAYQYPKQPILPQTSQGESPKRRQLLSNKVNSLQQNENITPDTYTEMRYPYRDRKNTSEPLRTLDEPSFDNRKSSQVKPQVNKQRQPFRPTEIPSPIYGFQKRKQHEKELVEFELNGLVEEDIAIAFEKNTNDTLLHEKEATKEPAFHTLMTGRVDRVEEYLPSQESPNFELQEANDVSVINVIKSNTDDSLDDNTIPAFLPSDSYGTEIEVSSDSSEETVEQFDLQGDSEEKDKDLEVNIEQTPVNREEISSKPRTDRKVLPFNVMMLKKDREFIEKQKQMTQDIQQGHQNQSNFVQTQIEKPNQTFAREKKEISFSENPELHIKETEHDKKFNPTETTMDYFQTDYQYPSKTMLMEPVQKTTNHEWLQDQAQILNNTLKSFNVGAKVVGVSEGPTVTRFEISPEMGVKVNKITNLTDDLKLSLAARDIRIEAPIPGKHTIGIEVPNKTMSPVYLREILDKEEFANANSPLTVALGLDISGNPIITDLKKMPHGLIAGATGSGKSVCINTFIVSLLFKAKPEEVKLMLIDPKMVELAPYNHIPHLISPVITDVKAATAALKWAVEEMERRYELFAAAGVRDISKFNEKDATNEHHMPYLVIIIDELADLMMVAPADVEESIARIAQKARACGIHLLIATQRPSVDVITGLIKANVPTRIAFSVSSQVDSRTIIDISGAERLLGKGDMLFLDNGTSKPIRLQGPFITDEEIERIVEFVQGQGEPHYLFEQEELIKKADIEENDDLLMDACEYAVQQGSISTSSLQRHFRIGYNRAARIIEIMEQKGLISEARGSKPRDVLISEQDLLQFTEAMI